MPNVNIQAQLKRRLPTLVGHLRTALGKGRPRSGDEDGTEAEEKVDKVQVLVVCRRGVDSLVAFLPPLLEIKTPPARACPCSVCMTLNGVLRACVDRDSAAAGPFGRQRRPWGPDGDARLATLSRAQRFERQGGVLSPSFLSLSLSFDLFPCILRTNKIFSMSDTTRGVSTWTLTSQFINNTARCIYNILRAATIHG